MVPEQQPSLRIYALNKQILPNQNDDFNFNGFASAAARVFEWVNAILYPIEEKKGDIIFGNSSFIEIQGLREDEVVYDFGWTKDQPINIVMPFHDNELDYLPYCMLGLLIYSWYGEKVRVMTSNIPEMIWQRAVFLYHTLLHEYPLDGRTGAPTFGQQIRLTPDVYKADGPYRIEGIGNAYPEDVNFIEGLRINILMATGLISSDLVSCTSESFEGMRQAITKIRKSYPRLPSVVTPVPAPVSEPTVHVPTADPIDAFYHPVFEAAKDRLVNNNGILVLHSVDAGTGKTTIVQQLATTLLVPYIYVPSRLFAADGLLTPDVQHAWANGGLLHITNIFAGQDEHVQQLYLLDIKAFVENLQLYSVTYPNRAPRHKDCYLVLEMPTKVLDNILKFDTVLALRLGRHTLRVDFDQTLASQLLTVNSKKDREFIEYILKGITICSQKNGKANQDMGLGLYPVAMYRELLATWETPQGAAEQLVLRMPCFSDEQRVPLLQAALSISGAAIKKSKPSKSKAAKKAEEATPAEQAQALADAIAPALTNTLAPLPALAAPQDIANERAMDDLLDSFTI